MNLRHICIAVTIPCINFKYSFYLNWHCNSLAWPLYWAIIFRYLSNVFHGSLNMQVWTIYYHQYRVTID